MRYLLDSHTFLWILFAPEKLSKKAKETIIDIESEVAVSVVSFWEISLKYVLGKLDLINITPDALPPAAEEAGIDILQMTPQDAAGFFQLPKLAHRDPFDRMIIWQAIQQRMTLVSKDRSFKDYKKQGLKIHW